MKSLAVFCGSRPGNNPKFLTGAKILGEEIVKRNITLVYGGSSVGLMGEVANTVLQGKGKVIGVMPQKLADREIAHQNLSELHIVKSMHERKNLMAELSHGFITLPGGFGTMDEICEMITWNVLNIHAKPCGFLNLEGFFDPFFNFIRGAVSENFISSECQSSLLIETDAAKLIEKIIT